jgi:CRP/FNR family transcriptional regulator
MIDLKQVQHARVLAGLTPEERATLGQIAQTTELKKGDHAFHLGDEADTLFIIERGLIQLTLPLQVRSKETEVVTEELSGGDSLAWSALIRPHTLTMNARAMSPCKLIALARSDLQELFAREPTLGWKFMTNLAGLVSRRLRVSQAMWASELQEHVIKQYG